MKKAIAKIIQDTVEMEEGGYKWGDPGYHLTRVEDAAKLIEELITEKGTLILVNEFEYNRMCKRVYNNLGPDTDW